MPFNLKTQYKTNYDFFHKRICHSPQTWNSFRTAPHLPDTIIEKLLQKTNKGSIKFTYLIIFVAIEILI
jgi:hypothetical protein